MKLQTTPIASVGDRVQSIRICSNRLVIVTGKNDGLRWCSKDLKRGKSIIDSSRSTASNDAAPLHFENGSRIDHHRYTTRHFEGDTVGENGIAHAPTPNFISRIVPDRGEIIVSPYATDYANNVTGRYGCRSRSQTRKRFCQGTVCPPAEITFIDHYRLRAWQGIFNRGCRSEPEIKVPTSQSVTVAIQSGSRSILDGRNGIRRLEIQ